MRSPSIFSQIADAVAALVVGALSLFWLDGALVGDNVTQPSTVV